MSGLGKGVSGMVGISQNEVGAGTFPDRRTPSSCAVHGLVGLIHFPCKLLTIGVAQLGELTRHHEAEPNEDGDEGDGVVGCTVGKGMLCDLK